MTRKDGMNSGGSKSISSVVADAGGRPADAMRVLLTPKLAQAFLDRMPKNRPLSEPTVDRYAAFINSDDWPYTGAAIVFSVAGFMIDGQHRCHAVIRTGQPIDVLVVFDAPEAAYHRQDIQKRRCGGDYLDGIPLRNAVAGALRLLHEEEVSDARNVIRGDRVALEAGDHPAVLARYPGIVDCVRACYPLRSMVQPAIAIYAIFRTCCDGTPEQVQRFWHGVATGEGLVAGDARLTLRNQLLGQTRARKMARSHVLALIIRAWTGFRNGATVHLLRWSEGTAFPVWPGPTLAEVASGARRQGQPHAHPQ